MWRSAKRRGNRFSIFFNKHKTSREEKETRRMWIPNSVPKFLHLEARTSSHWCPPGCLYLINMVNFVPSRQFKLRYSPQNHDRAIWRVSFIDPDCFLSRWRQSWPNFSSPCFLSSRLPPSTRHQPLQWFTSKSSCTGDDSWRKHWRLVATARWRARQCLDSQTRSNARCRRTRIHHLWSTNIRPNGKISTSQPQGSSMKSSACFILGHPQLRHQSRSSVLQSHANLPPLACGEAAQRSHISNGSWCKGFWQGNHKSLRRSYRR